MTNRFTELLTLIETSPRSFEMSTGRRETIMDALRIAAGHVALPPIPHGSTNEKLIVGKLVEELLAAGFTLSVNDGEDVTLSHSTDTAAIYAALSSTDEDHLIVHAPKTHDRAVRLVWGNDVDVISDYHSSLEPYVVGATELSNKLY